MEAMRGDNSKKPAEPRTNLMRVSATSKRRLDDLLDEWLSSVCARQFQMIE